MIRIASSQEFMRLLEALAQDVGSANIHWRLYRDLHAAHGRNREIWNQSQTFWSLTLNAHTFTAVQCLGRAFDQNQSALHLLSWLKTIQENLHLFEASAFKTRLVGNPFVDSLSEYPRIPDATQLAEDIARCSATDPKVNALIRHRNNISAHRNARTTAGGRGSAADFAIPVEDFELLLDRAHEIVNRYSSLFAATSYSRQMIGHDDYQYVFNCVEESLKRWNEQNEG